MVETQQQDNRKQRVYTTEIVESLMRDMALGYVVDKTPFYPFDSELKNANVTFKMTQEEEDEFIKCSMDAIYFVEKYCKFLTDNGRVTVKLRNYQKKIIRAVTDSHYDENINEMVPDNRDVLIMAARQSGKTTTTAAYMTWYVCFNTDRNIGIMANKEDTAKEIVAKTLEMIKGLPYFLKPGVVSWGKKGAQFDNGCAIISSATTKSASIGFTMNGILYLDEFAHIDPNICNSFWRSVYPTLSSSKTAQCIISSTPNGTQNKFYELWSNSVDGKNSMMNIRVDYWEVPGRDENWVQEMISKFGEEEFNQEFRLQFSSSSSTLLKGTYMEKLLALCERTGKYVSRDIFYAKYLDDENIVWHPDFDPTDINPEDRFVFLVDLAEGNAEDEEVVNADNVKTPDANTIIICKVVPNSVANMKKYAFEGLGMADAFRFIQVGKYSRNDMDEIYCGNVCAALAYDLFHSDVNDNVRIMVEMNFNGKSFLTTLQNHPLYYDDSVLSTYHTTPIPGDKTTQKKKFGFKTNSTKVTYCKRGAKLFYKRRIIPTDMATYTQLNAFGKVGNTYKGIAMHDDLSLPMLNHIPRMLDESTFIDWLTEYFENMSNTDKKYAINNLIEHYEMDNPNEVDEAMTAFLNRKQDYAMGNLTALSYEIPKNYM